VLAGGHEQQCRAQFEWTASSRAFGSFFAEAIKVENLVSRSTASSIREPT